MKQSRFYVLKFLFTKLRNSLLIGCLISSIIFVFFGKSMFEQYWVGLLIGILNFALLTIGIDLILLLRPLLARVIHFLFFALRYIAITFVIVLYILHKNANAFIIIGGLLTMHFSIFVVEIKKHSLSRKEG